MANSTSPVPLVVEGTGAVAKLNELFDAMSQGLIGGKNWATTSLLAWGYLGGRINSINVANGTVTLTANTTNYVVMAKATGVVSVSTATTNWNDIGNYWKLYSIVVGATAPTSYTDERFGATGPWGIGGGLNNPMTTPGDMIIGATAGAPNRLAPGAAAQVLTMVAGLPAWAAAGAATADMLSPRVYADVSVTAAATATLDKWHVCSGTSADYALTLPAAASSAGRFVGIRMAPGLTRWVTVTGNGAELIDGSNTRRMWANETAVLLCDGTGWTKVAGKTIPIKVAMRRAATFSVPSGVWTTVPADSTLFDNTSGLAVPSADTSNGRINVFRAGDYQLSGRMSIIGITPGRIVAGGGVWGTAADMTGGAGPNTPGGWSAAPASSGGVASGYSYGNGSATVNVTTSHYFYMYAFLDDTTSRNTNTAADTVPFVTVAEIPRW